MKKTNYTTLYLLLSVLLFGKPALAGAPQSVDNDILSLSESKTSSNKSERDVFTDEPEEIYAQFIQDPESLDVTDIREVIGKLIQEGRADEALRLLVEEEINLSRGIFLRFRSSANTIKNQLAEAISDLEELRKIIQEESGASSDLLQVNFDLMFVYYRAGYDDLALELATQLENDPEAPTYFAEQIAKVRSEIELSNAMSRDISVIPTIARDFNGGISKSNYGSYYDGQTAYYEYIEKISPFVRGLGRSYEITNEQVSRTGWSLKYNISGTLNFKLPPQRIVGFYAGVNGSIVFEPGLSDYSRDYTSTGVMSGFYISWLSGTVSRTLNFRFSRDFQGDYSHSLSFLVDASLGIPISNKLFLRPGVNLGAKAYDNSASNVAFDRGVYTSLFITTHATDSLSLYAGYTRSLNKDDLRSYNRYTFAPGYNLRFEPVDLEFDFSISHVLYDRYPFGNTLSRKDNIYSFSTTIVPKEIVVLEKNIGITLGASITRSNYKAANSVNMILSFSTRSSN